MVKQTRYLGEIDQSNFLAHRQSKSHLHHEAGLGERVGVHHDAGDIANDFQDEAAEHAAKKTPNAVANTKEDLCDQA